MRRTLCKSKIHRATITEANVNYVGSVTIDEDLLERADILPYEQVHVVNVTNGERLVTYAITGARGSGVICLNGAAAHKGSPGDIVFVDENNRAVETIHPDAAHSELAAQC